MSESQRENRNDEEINVLPISEASSRNAPLNTEDQNPQDQTQATSRKSRAKSISKTLSGVISDIGRTFSRETSREPSPDPTEPQELFEAPQDLRRRPPAAPINAQVHIEQLDRQPNLQHSSGRAAHPRARIAEPMNHYPFCSTPASPWTPCQACRLHWLLLRRRTTIAPTASTNSEISTGNGH
jgi:hypothetical protein